MDEVGALSVEVPKTLLLFVVLVVFTTFTLLILSGAVDTFGEGFGKIVTSTFNEQGDKLIGSLTTTGSLITELGNNPATTKACPGGGNPVASAGVCFMVDNFSSLT